MKQAVSSPLDLRRNLTSHDYPKKDMARQKLSPELKKAISTLSDKEKDKLLYRFVAKESLLAEQLTFRLLEQEATTEERRDIAEEKIIEQLEEIKEYRFSPKLLAWAIRACSGITTRHVRVTKDKYGEVSLSLFFLTEALERFGTQLLPFSSGQKTQSLYDYLVKRTLKVFTLLSKLHPETHLDFRPRMEQLGQLMEANTHLIRTATIHHLDLNWLLEGEWPDTL